jgi:hypothetical protein
VNIPPVVLSYAAGVLFNFVLQRAEALCAGAAALTQREGEGMDDETDTTDTNEKYTIVRLRGEVARLREENGRLRSRTTLVSSTCECGAWKLADPEFQEVENG